MARLIMMRAGIGIPRSWIKKVKVVPKQRPSIRKEARRALTLLKPSSILFLTVFNQNIRVRKARPMVSVGERKPLASHFSSLERGEIALESERIRAKPLATTIIPSVITKGGILLPDKFKDDAKYLTTIGRVLKVGELAYADHDKFKGRAWCKPGDYVVYGKYQGDKFFYKGIRMLLLFDDQILMVVPDPADLDPNYLDIDK